MIIHVLLINSPLSVFFNFLVLDVKFFNQGLIPTRSQINCIFTFQFMLNVKSNVTSRAILIPFFSSYYSSCCDLVRQAENSNTRVMASCRHDAFDIADPAWCRTRVTYEPSKWPCSPRVVVWASDPRCAEGHGYDSRRGLRFISLSGHARDKNGNIFLRLDWASFHMYYVHMAEEHIVYQNASLITYIPGLMFLKGLVVIITHSLYMIFFLCQP